MLPFLSLSFCFPPLLPFSPLPLPPSPPHLWQVGDRLDTEALEDEAQGLDGHGVVLREALVLQNAHEGVDGNGRVEVLQTRSTAHGHQQLTGSVPWG